MTLKNIFIGFSIFCMASVLTISCVRERDTDIDIASDNTIAEFAYNDALTIADDAAEKNPGENLSNYKTLSNCAIVNKTSTGGVNTITVDFGAANCLCSDGRNRRGKINVTYVGAYKADGSVHEITFDNYYLDNNQIMGTKTVTNMGLNSNNQTYFNIVVAGKIVKPNNGGTMSWNSSRTRTWIAGENTVQWSDDIYSITGKGNGTNTLGINYSYNITKPLVKAMPIVCKYFTEGTIEMQPQAKALRTIDFGKGDCDNIATVVINNKTYNITLK